MRIPIYKRASLRTGKIESGPFFFQVFLRNSKASLPGIYEVTDETQKN
ncbi:hypothetical protein LEP1GSC047_1659 [Leptospira inadai serovar Lyme str. 10]|uniref:Uncharacterized protein n=1 Tax=Leptospira inadai serovar Lyme str. 10 TaxID=1049790 RepID=V6H922_9LEPT|nr:hypothetical protein LEP1GSC047_1659 [Leptospira inadai serovar Lyme str. 10]